MTRINVVPVEELSDQHLIAEYRELPRCIKQKINVKNAPTTYCLGVGHMKWARAHIKFLLRRYRQLCIEMAYRGFTVNFGWDNLVYIACLYSPAGCLNTDYAPTRKDLKLNKERLIEKYRKKPTFYKWTQRKKPKYMEV